MSQDLYTKIVGALVGLALVLLVLLVGIWQLNQMPSMWCQSGISNCQPAIRHDANGFVISN